MLLKVSRSALHGNGCFAVRDISPGEVVSESRLLIIPPEETEVLGRTRLRNYVFYVRDGATEDGPYFSALALGPVSFCNHSSDATCDFRLDEPAGEITLIARRAIAEGEEITIDYGDYAEEIV